MGSLTFPLSTSAPRWPDCCAVCCGEADDKVLTTVATNKDFHAISILVRWKKYSLQFPFPVCMKHRKLCWLLDLPARWGFIDAFLVWLFVPALLWIAFDLSVATIFGIKGEALAPFSETAAIVLWGAATAYYIAAATVKPVSLSGLHKGELTIYIRNDQYFRKFQALNATPRTIA